MIQTAVKIYSVKKNEQFVGMYTAKEIANLCKCKEGTVGVYARNGLRLYGEYEFKAVDSKPLGKELRALSLAYEKVRNRLLNSRYDLSRIKIVPETEPENEDKGSKNVGL